MTEIEEKLQKLAKEYIGDVMCDSWLNKVKSLIAEEVQGIIGEDENLTVVGRKYFTNTGEMEEMIGDGEEEWKIPRNDLRAEQRKLAKEKGVGR